jgi:hypothetical protein
MTTAGGMNGSLTEFLRPRNSCNRVLVAEDDAMFHRMLRSWLENWGYSGYDCGRWRKSLGHSSTGAPASTAHSRLDDADDHWPGVMSQGSIM